MTKNKIIIISLNILCVMGVIYLLIFNNQKNDNFCTTQDDYVIDVVERLQDYYFEKSTFPETSNINQESVLINLTNDYNIDFFQTRDRMKYISILSQV